MVLKTDQSHTSLRAASRISWIETFRTVRFDEVSIDAFGLLPELVGLKQVDRHFLIRYLVEAFGLLPELVGLKRRAFLRS